MDATSTAEKLALRDRLKEKVRHKPITLRPEQRITDANGQLVVIVGGRRSGKTVAAAERTADLLIVGRGLIAVVAPTFAQARDVALEQAKSGVLDALARRGVRVRREGRGEWEWNRSIGELRYRGEAVLRIDSLEDGAPRVQGHSIGACWIDELRLASDRDAQQALNTSIWPALSGQPGQLIVTSTPAPTRMIRQLLRDPHATFAG